MSRGILKGIAKVAQIVAVVATVTGSPLIAAIATLVAVAAGTGAQLLQKKPPARGSVTQVTVGSDPPQPCILGESYYGGILRHDTGYGATLKKVPNPYRWLVIVYSGCGPLDSLVAPQIDFAAIDNGYYGGFLSTATQLGATPEATALVPPLSAPAPGWGAASKLSGQAAIGWNFKFDKDGKVFANGLPVLGAVWKGVKVYDPRLDSTYPGGAGAQRIANEATWTWSANPALHALAYAYGRRQNPGSGSGAGGKLVFGVGLPVEAIRVADFVTLANVCDANVWRLSGVIFEPGDRWANLKEILRAGGAEPISAAGLLSLRVRQPQVALATIADRHLLGSAKVTPMQTYVDRLNTVVPKYRSPAHNWELVAADQVQVATYLAEDGEEMIEEIEWGLVRDVNQVTQLARYRLEDGREYPVELTVGPEFRAFRPGECLHLSIAALGVETDAVILTRRIDPATLEVTFGFASETAGKHAFALGMTGTPPPTPALGQSAAQRDTLRFEEKAWVQVGDHIAEVVSGTVKAGGGVATNMVDTNAIVADNVTAPWRVQSSTVIAFAAATKTQILSVTVAKAKADSYLELAVQVPMTGPDAIDIDIGFEAQQAGVAIQSSPVYRIELDANGATRLPWAFTEELDALAAGTYDVKMFGTRFTAKNCSTDGTYKLRVREFKR